MRKLKVDAAVAADFVRMLRGQAESLVPEPVPATACRDRDDLAILGLVVPGKADVVVSGDKDLLVLQSFKGVPILTPRQFWERCAR